DLRTRHVRRDAVITNGSVRRPADIRTSTCGAGLTPRQTPWMSERERLVALEGALNWRDLGGYPTADGHVTRWDRLYRADGLDQLTDADLDVIADLGIRLVIDFRVDREVDEAPSRLPDHPELRRQRLPIDEDVASTSVIDRIQSGEITKYSADDVAATCERILEDAAHEFGIAM